MSVKHALLALLYRQPLHGYELTRQLNQTIAGEWEVKVGQIASTLLRLKEAGLVDCAVVEAADAPDRKVYHLTVTGLEELNRWYMQPDVREYHLDDAFYIKLVLSLVGGPVQPERVLMIQRRQLFQELHQVTEIQRQANPEHDLPWILLLDSARMHLEADLRWIEMCEARLTDLKKYRPPPAVVRPRGRPRRQAIPEITEQDNQ